MKILLCIPQLKKGGAERVMNNLANYFIKENDVILYCLKDFPSAYEFDNKIKVIFHKTLYKNKVFENINRLKEIKKIIKNEKIDIILSFLPQSIFLVLLARGFKKNPKIIASVRNDPKIEYCNIVFKILSKILFNRVDGFVFQTSDAKNYFSKKIQNKSIIIPNSLNPDFIVNKPSKKRNNEIVTVGRLFEQKNHILLIDAYEKFSKVIKGYKLIIYGKGPLHDKINNYIIEKKLIGNVVLAGQVDDIKSKIYDSNIFVLSSNYEGMPNALMEALSLGIPCISTDCPCGGPRELIKHGKNGYLVPINNCDELCNMMINLVSNEELKNMFSCNSIEMMKQYNPKIINKKWLEFLKEIYKN